MPKLDAIGIITANTRVSQRFYSLLGIDAPIKEDDHVEATLSNGLRIMWDTEELVKKIDPTWEKPTGQRLGLAFLCDSPADVDETYKLITKNGFTGLKEPWDAFWGQRYAQVQDPDGNSVDLFAPL